MSDYESDREEDPYYEGLDEDAIEALNTLQPADVMIFDLERGIKVTVGFAEIIQDDCAATLKAFVTTHPQYSDLIDPILAYDSEYASAGELKFKRAGDEVKVKLILNPMYNDQEKVIHKYVISLDKFRQFVTLTEPFAGFTTANGELALNY